MLFFPWKIKVEGSCWRNSAFFLMQHHFSQWDLAFLWFGGMLIPVLSLFSAVNLLFWHLFCHIFDIFLVIQLIIQPWVWTHLEFMQALVYFHYFMILLSNSLIFGNMPNTWICFANYSFQNSLQVDTPSRYICADQIYLAI